MNKTFTILLFLLFPIVIFSQFSSRQGSWIKTNGPFGGKINALSFDSSNSLYAATDAGLYILNSSEGEIWQKIIIKTDNSEFFSDVSVKTILIKGTDIFISTDKGYLYSSDLGINWIKTGDGLPENVNGLIKTDTGIILASSISGLFRSLNNGKSFSKIYLDEIYSLTASGNFVAAGGKNGNLFLSKNGGKSWLNTKDNLDKSSIKSLSVNSKDVIFAGTNSGKIYSSEDLGNSWILSDSTDGSSWLSTLITYDSIDVYAVFKKDSSSSNIKAGKAEGVYFLRDLGNRWIKKSLGLINSHITSMAIDKGGNIFLGTEEGVFSYDISNNIWVKIDKGLTAYSFAKFQTDTSGGIYALTSSGLYHSANNGLSWEEANHDIKKFSDMSLSKEEDIYAISPYGIYLLRDGEETWEILHEKTLSNGQKNNKVSYIYISLRKARICFSKDNGQSWKEGIYGLPESTNGYTLGISSSGYLFAFIKGMGIYKSPRSLSRTIQYIQSSDGKRWLTGSLHEIKWRCNNIDTIKIEFSTDNGKNWLIIKDSLSSIQGTYTWKVPETPSVRCKIKISDMSDPSMFSTSDSLFAIVLPQTEETRKTQRPEDEENSLFQNYPNPFNPLTNIKFKISQAGYVSLKLYNVIGKEIATLFSGEKPAGTYEITFDASEIPSGIYYYRLISGKYVEVKKLTVVK
ncbi:MAG: T9SS type A sorting domain-containing protein [Bacteroidota bacterium]|nr:T9SS type A sorting domain-containing protein [Bacteroidota bacterium]